MDQTGATEINSLMDEHSGGDIKVTTKRNESNTIFTEPETAGNPAIIYGVEDRPPWASVALMGLQHFSISFSGCFALPLIVAGPLCFDLDRSLLNQLIGTSFFISGLTTFLQTFLGTRLPIIQGPSAAFIVPAIVLFSLQGPCPQSLTNNSTVEERRFARDVALGRMQELQGSICLASLVQFVVGFTGLVGILLRFIRPITIGTTLLLIGIPILPIASDASGTHWGISSLDANEGPIGMKQSDIEYVEGCMFLVILFSQFLDKYDIPLFKGKRLALFTFFPILLAVSISWIVCLILTTAGAFPDDPTEYGYKARADIYNEDIKDAAWFRFPYPGQFGLPTVSVAGFIGMFAGVVASIVESVGDYHACALISNAPPPPIHAINRGIGMEGIGCVAAGLWGASCGYTSLSNNISAISLTKVASRVTAYFAAGLYVLSGIMFKFNALCAAIPEPIIGGILACTFGMVSSIGFANLSFIKINTSRNLFILGFALFLGMGVPDYLTKNPGAINTGSTLIDQVLNVTLGSNMFIGGLTACILDNLVRGTPEEKGLNWRREMLGIKDGDVEENTGYQPSCYDLPFGMNLIRRTHWTRYLPFSPTFTGFRNRNNPL